MVLDSLGTLPIIPRDVIFMLIGSGATIVGGTLLKEGTKDAYAKVKAFVWTRILNRELTQENEAIMEAAQGMGNLSDRLSEKDARIEELMREKSEYELLAAAMKNRNISKEDLIERYWNRLPAIILTFSHQKDEDGEKDHFVKRVLKDKYDLQNISAQTWAIPPTKVPTELRKLSATEEDIEEWVEETIYGEYENHKAKIFWAGIVDLRKVYSRNDKADESDPFNARTIHNVFDLDGLFESQDIPTILARNNISLSEVVEEGHVPFLATHVISDEEHFELMKHDDEINSQLGVDNLSDIAQMDTSEVADALRPYVSNPNRVADGVIKMANIWEEKLTMMRLDEDANDEEPDETRE